MANNKDFKVKNGIQPTVYHEGLGTVTSGTQANGFDLTVASYVQSFDVSGKETNPNGVFFKTDGTKMFVAGSAGDDVNEYTLSTAYDVSTASYDSVFSVSAQDSNVKGLFFKPDGTIMYIMGAQNNSVFQYTLSTAWDVSTASYASKSFSVSTQESSPEDVFFKPDGTKMYVVGANGDEVNEYDLSTAWDVSTCTYNQTFSVAAQDTGPRGVAFSDDGTQMFIAGDGGDDIIEYTLSTAWDISTASYTRNYVVSGQQTGISGLTFANSGTKLYTSDEIGDSIYEYNVGEVITTNTLDLSTGSVFEITPTSDIEINLSNPATSGTVSQATLLLDGAVVNTDGYDLSVLSYDNKTKVVFDSVSNPHAVRLSSDGTKMYVLQQQSAGTDDRVEEYDLSTAWDISTANYSQELDVSSFTSKPDDMFFKPDGSAIFLLDSGDDKVTMRTLSTAWDVSTAGTPTQSYTTTLTSVTNGLFFKSDGTEMFFAGQATAGGVVDQYTLSTAWDVTTATFYDRFTVNTQTGDPQSLALSSDGTVLFVLGSNDDIYEYSLSTAWDLKTASYTSNNYSINAQNNSMYGIHFRDDGYKMYAVGWVEEAVYQYTSGTQTPATITYDTTLEWPSGTAPTSPAIGETDVITFTTSDGGTSYQAVQAIDGAK